MPRPAILVATGLGVGRFPVAPATAASLAVVLLVAFLEVVAPGALAPIPLAVLILLLLPLSVWASGEAEKVLGLDAKPIVIDEVVGMLVSVWGLGLEAERPGPLLAAAFLLFRVFDILKPFPIRWSQRLPGGYGVVVDDVLAGLATNAALRVLRAMGAPL